MLEPERELAENVTRTTDMPRKKCDDNQQSEASWGRREISSPEGRVEGTQMKKLNQSRAPPDMNYRKT
jgi:hypothetical protein